MALFPEVVAAAAPFLVIGGLLWFTSRIRGRREACIARQIALTDAIHRELGAAAAHVVERSWIGAWTVTIAVPLERETLVGALTRITQELFVRLDHAERPWLQVVLSQQELMFKRQAQRSASRARVTRAEPDRWPARMI